MKNEGLSRISLIGYMGCGKSYLGRQLAISLNLPFFDLDEVIGQLSGCSLTDLMKRKGEMVFRDFEKRALEMVLNKDSFVLACGGGTPAYYDNMDKMLAKTTVVYLDCSIPTLEARLLPDTSNRPLLDGLASEDVSEFIAKHLFERRPYYERAHKTVRGDAISVDNIIDVLK